MLHDRNLLLKLKSSVVREQHHANKDI